MRMFDADAPIIRDLKDESELIGEKSTAAFNVVTARHPTLGKLVIISAKDGTGIVVEADE